MRGDRQIEEFRVELGRLSKLVDDLGRLVASLNGGAAVAVPGETPQSLGKPPLFISDPATEAALDKYIKDWRANQGQEDG